MTTITSSPRHEFDATDSELIACSDGEDAAFRILVDRHSRAIRQYLAARVGPQAAEDLLAETFGVAWRVRHTFRPGSSTARPWLYGIATKLLQEHRAVERRWQLGIQAMARAEQPPPADLAETFPDLDLDLVLALSSLSDTEREILVLVALGELSVVEAAAATGVSKVAARVRLHRARRSMRQALSNHLEARR